MDSSRSWTTGELAQIDASAELTIAAPRRDGGWRRAVPIWVVTVGDAVYVRTWRLRETGWYGAVRRAGRARIGVPGVSAEVSVTDASGDDPELRRSVDDAYRAKYGRPGDATVSGVVTEDAAATTLRLTPFAVYPTPVSQPRPQ
ncbi:DUF2255 family protein [Gryllotalpicola koreensis]|uniref:DUF2255 family protein n=1 Tax=Gryllotalpicola koreensis TaxID=993086 RepID=A0ABP7ZPY3_9MICO